MAARREITINATSQPPINDFYHPLYIEQFYNWVKMDDLYAGEDRVKMKREVYLKPTSLELNEVGGVIPSIAVGSTTFPDYRAANFRQTKKTKYDQRLDRAVFFNGVSRHTRYAMGHLFRENPRFSDRFSREFEDFIKNCDLLGTPFIQFIKNVSAKSYVMGHYHILVEFPKTDETIDSLKAQRESNVRPYLVAINPLDLINWSISQKSNGKYQFDWAVFRYVHSVSLGPFMPVESRTRYKVWYPDRWEIYELEQTTANKNRKEGPKRILVDKGVNGLGYVPIFTVYSNPVSPMQSIPPLLEAADLNLSHYQSYSFFNNGLMYHLNPLLTIIGANTDQIKLNAAVGLTLPREGDAKYVEFTGTALNIAKDTSKEIAMEMWEAGLRNTSFLGANTSAEARRVARSDFTSWLETVSTLFESSWVEIAKAVGDWVDVELSDSDAKISLNKDFDVSILESSLAEFLLRLRAGGEISHETLLKELQRGEVITKAINVQDEMKQAQVDLVKDLELASKFDASSTPSADVANPPGGVTSDTGKTPSGSTRGNGSRTSRRRGSTAAATTA